MDSILMNMKLDTWLKIIDVKQGNLLFQSRRTAITYNHVVNIYRHLDDCGLIRMEKVGREYHIKLTEKGERLRDLFSKMNDMLGEIHGTAEKLAEVSDKENV